MALDEGIPEMLSLEPSFLQHFIRYQTRRYFNPSAGDTPGPTVEDINDFYVHDIGEHFTFFGPTIEGKYEGLGLLYDQTQKGVIEAGFYKDGLLDGYGMRSDKVQGKD